MRRLWQSVLLNVFRDLCAKGDSAFAYNARMMAQRWVGDFPSRDFKMVCDLCGFEPAATHMRMMEITRMSLLEREQWWKQNGFHTRTQKGLSDGVDQTQVD